MAQVDWNLVDHSPGASFISYDIQELTELTNEVFTIKHRAPDIAIALPKGRANVRQAAKYIYGAKQTSPKKVDELRREVYRAYWLRGEDIESVEVLERIARRLDIPAIDLDDPTLDEYVETATKVWRGGPFENRLPAMRRDIEKPLCGLPSKKDCVGYVLTGTEVTFDYSSHSCEYAAKPILVAMGDWARFWHVGDLLREELDIIYVGMLDSLSEQRSSGLNPDIVVVAETEEHRLLPDLQEVKALLDQSTALVTLLDKSGIDASEHALYSQSSDEIIDLEQDVIQVKRKLMSLINKP